MKRVCHFGVWKYLFRSVDVGLSASRVCYVNIVCMCVYKPESRKNHFYRFVYGSNVLLRKIASVFHKFVDSRECLFYSVNLFSSLPRRLNWNLRLRVPLLQKSLFDKAINFRHVIRLIHFRTNVIINLSIQKFHGNISRLLCIRQNKKPNAQTI